MKLLASAKVNGRMLGLVFLGLEALLCSPRIHVRKRDSASSGEDRRAYKVKEKKSMKNSTKTQLNASSGEGEDLKVEKELNGQLILLKTARC